MSAFTYDHPATFTTPATRGSLRIFAYVNAKGRIVTDSDAGGWTMKTAKGIVDSAGDVHPLDNDAQSGLLRRWGGTRRLLRLGLRDEPFGAHSGEQQAARELGAGPGGAASMSGEHRASVGGDAEVKRV